MLKDLSPHSEPTDKAPVTKKARSMRIRACNGPYRNMEFRLYPAPGPGDPFGGPWPETITLDTPNGTVIYEVHQDPDPRHWALTVRKGLS